MGRTQQTLYARLGTASRRFRACDTDVVIKVTGIRAEQAAGAAKQEIRRLEAQLDRFNETSAAAELNETGQIHNEHIATIVQRGREYLDRTDGVFDIRHGECKDALNRYLRGDDNAVHLGGDTSSASGSTGSGSMAFAGGTISVDGERVETDTALDLNGLAKGYIVDQAAKCLDGVGRRGFVSGGGDMSPPTGAVGIESPYRDDKHLKTLATNWNIATTGGYRRERDGIDHIYDPTAERIGSRHESVTVLAARDCMEADAMATTLAALPLAAAKQLAADWDGVEALIVHGGVFHTTEGFDEHVVEG